MAVKRNASSGRRADRPFGSLATSDTSGTLDQVRKDIAEFFERYAEF